MTAQLKQWDVQEPLRANVEKLAKRARDGEVEAILCLYIDKRGVLHLFKNNLSYKESIGMAQHAAYILSREWYGS